MAYIQSPCIRNFCLNNDVCLGCFCTIDEIKQWAHTKISIQEKQQILANAEERKINNESAAYCLACQGKIILTGTYSD